MTATTSHHYPPLSTRQLCLLRAVKTQGWPADLLEHLLSRCGADSADWQGTPATRTAE